MKNTKISGFILIFSIGFLFMNIYIPHGSSLANLGTIPKSCTIFTVAIGDKVFFGNNEDFLLDGKYKKDCFHNFKQISGGSCRSRNFNFF
jgi:hypothetical protein